MRQEFDLESEFQSYQLPDVRSRNASPVSGPAELLYLLKLRELIKDEVDWGNSVASDLFVFSDGESTDRTATKCGGLPYWSLDSPWPRNSDGEPMVFLGQINFDQSKDLVDQIPGNLLMVFGDDGGLDDYGFFAGFCCMWQKVDDNTPLIDSLPDGVKGLKGVEGHRCRINQYPNAVPKQCEWHEFRVGDKNIGYGGLISSIQGTQIFGSRNRQSKQKTDSPTDFPIASISTIGPTLGVELPWVGHRMPIDDLELAEYDKYLRFGDADCLDISIAENGEPCIVGW